MTNMLKFVSGCPTLASFVLIAHTSCEFNATYFTPSTVAFAPLLPILLPLVPNDAAVNPHNSTGS